MRLVANRQAATAIRKVIEFIREHTDDYDPGIRERVVALVERLRSAGRNLIVASKLALPEGTTPPTITNRPQVAARPINLRPQLQSTYPIRLLSKFELLEVARPS